MRRAAGWVVAQAERRAALVPAAACLAAMAGPGFEGQTLVIRSK